LDLGAPSEDAAPPPEAAAVAPQPPRIQRATVQPRGPVQQQLVGGVTLRRPRAVVPVLPTAPGVRSAAPPPQGSASGEAIRAWRREPERQTAPTAAVPKIRVVEIGPKPAAAPVEPPALAPPVMEAPAAEAPPAKKKRAAAPKAKKAAATPKAKAKAAAKKPKTRAAKKS
jgi:hypothetical protein